LTAAERLRIPAEIALATFVADLLVTLFSACSGPGNVRLASITVIVVIVTSSLVPRLSPGFNTLLRFNESRIGTAVAVLSVLLWPRPRSS
jgi:uncharacterized membrane protein YccC